MPQFLEMPPTFMENNVREFRKGERFMSRMMRVLSVLSFAVLLSFSAGFARLSAQSKSGSEPAKAVEALKGLQFREIGPAVMGGRVGDFALCASDPKMVFVGMASGG